MLSTDSTGKCFSVNNPQQWCKSFRSFLFENDVPPIFFVIDFCFYPLIWLLSLVHCSISIHTLFARGGGGLSICLSLNAS